ncbi:hypothetical protein PRIPAC_84681 [Pristionchus pacificus]|uniref:Uncharacterized protein n=1 Tax=Pristionchus pacificus TaxID=54126 RepID=A0A2A6BUA0_PRIPA|nr:hypothetical protein PRIPAC_84681 [Pristionchus pacificus]|eukprot:PDM69386.1 hypothetical protein PRIPAC_47688 [Pristionchus pacificus]
MSSQGIDASTVAGHSNGEVCLRVTWMDGIDTWFRSGLSVEYLSSGFEVGGLSVEYLPELSPYDTQYPEELVVNIWNALIARYRNQ